VSARAASSLPPEAGFALPLALGALTVCSLLLCTALVTASAERAMCEAHGDAARARYDAEGGIAAFLAQHPDSLGGDSATVEYAPPHGGTVQLRLLGLGETALAGDTLLRLVSVVARPVGPDSRAVAVLVKLLIASPDAWKVTAAGDSAAAVATGAEGSPGHPIIRAVGAWSEVTE
jgi:hypothetical protein